MLSGLIVILTVHGMMMPSVGTSGHSYRYRVTGGGVNVNLCVLELPEVDQE